jgi:isoleucyl-tRNA synthetase
LIKDEVNVKEIFLDEDMKDDIELDTTMTDELKEEGQLREVIRHIQDLRKKAGLKPADKVDIYYSTTGEVGKILSKNQKQILETTKSQRLLGSNNQQGDFLASKEVKIESSNLWLAISKI